MAASLSRRQLAVLGLGLITTAAVVLFPPWLAVTNWADGHVDRDPVGRHFLLTPPVEMTADLQATILARRRAGASLYFGPDFYVVDKTGLIIPLAVVSALMATGLVLSRDSRGRPRER